MYFRVFVYRIKKNLRDRELILWSLLFPIVLGTLFYMALGSIYKQAAVETKSVALVGGTEESTEFVKTTLEGIKSSEGTAMFEVTVADAADEQKLLFKDEVAGVMDISDMSDIRLHIAKDEVAQNVLAHVIGIFRRNAVLMQKAAADPASALKIMNLMTEDTELVKQVNAAGENKDPYVSFMYALLAMVCVMASNAGLQVPIDSQANISTQGARVSVTPVNHRMYELASLLAAFLIQTVCTMVGLFMIVGVYKVNMGCSIGFLILICILGTMLGCSLGFMLGHVSKLSKSSKEAILLLFVTFGGFLAGLMFDRMKMIVEMYCPIINRINPSALIHDAFYSLNIFGVGERFYRSMITMVVMTIVFTTIGLVMSRRRSYASI